MTMVAFNFKEQFANDVASGRKPGTIRKSKRCKVGDKVQLYTGQRTKNCRKLADAVCTGICQISICEAFPWAISKQEGELKSFGKLFHELDGFKNAKDFVDFFRQQYGLPFNGYYHQWEIVKNDKE